MAHDGQHTIISPSPGGEHRDHFNPSDIIRFLKGYARSIALCVLIPIGIAALYIIRTPPTYTARVQLLLDPRSPEPLAAPRDDALKTLDSAYVQSQIAVLRSENISMAVIHKLNLMADPDFLKQTGNSDGKQTDFINSRLAIHILDNNLDVRRSGTSYAIDISYSARDPQKAALVANTMARAFVDDQIDARSDAVRQGSRWLEERIENIRRQMNTAAVKVQRFRAKRDYRISRAGARDVDPARVSPAISGAADEAAPDAAASAPAVETLEELEATAQTYRRIYESSLQAYTESLQRQSLPMTNIRIITPATAPLRPSAPKKTLIIAFALLVGMLIGLGQAILRHNFARSLPLRRRH
ncbi:MAG: GumC family protein [Hyphomicrobiaceae bacterium]